MIRIYFFKIICVSVCCILLTGSFPWLIDLGSWGPRLARSRQTCFPSMVISARVTAVKIQISPPWTKHVAASDSSPHTSTHMNWGALRSQTEPFPPQQAHHSFLEILKKKKKRNNIFRMILLLLSPSINGYQTSVFSPSRLEYCLINVTSRCWEAQAALGTTDETG